MLREGEKFSATTARSPASVAVPTVPVYQETSFSSGSVFGSSSASSASPTSHHADGEHVEVRPEKIYSDEISNRSSNFLKLFYVSNVFWSQNVRLERKYLVLTFKY